MKRNLFLLGFLFFNMSLFAQDYIEYYNLVNEAEYWMYKKEYKKAETLYMRAFKVENPMKKDAYLMAKCYALTGNKEATLKWLKKSIEVSGSRTKDILKRRREYAVFQSVFSEDGEFEAIRQDLLLMKEKIDQKKKDHSYKMLKDTVIEFYRQCHLNKTEREQVNCTADARLSSYQRDFMVQYNLLEFIQENGYPGYTRTDLKLADALIMTLNESLLEDYQMVLYEELKEGNIYPKAYATVLEQIHLNKEKSCHLSLENYTKDFCVASDGEAIVQKRLEIGLSIYFQGYRMAAIEPYDLESWVTDAFVEEHSLLK